MGRSWKKCNPKNKRNKEVVGAAGAKCLSERDRDNEETKEIASLRATLKDLKTKVFQLQEKQKQTPMKDKRIKELKAQIDSLKKELKAKQAELDRQAAKLDATTELIDHVLTAQLAAQEVEALSNKSEDLEINEQAEVDDHSTHSDDYEEENQRWMEAGMNKPDEAQWQSQSWGSLGEDQEEDLLIVQRILGMDFSNCPDFDAVRQVVGHQNLEYMNYNNSSVTCNEKAQLDQEPLETFNELEEVREQLERMTMERDEEKAKVAELEKSNDNFELMIEGLTNKIEKLNQICFIKPNIQNALKMAFPQRDPQNLTASQKQDPGLDLCNLDPCSLNQIMQSPTHRKLLCQIMIMTKENEDEILEQMSTQDISELHDFMLKLMLMPTPDNLEEPELKSLEVNKKVKEPLNYPAKVSMYLKAGSGPIEQQTLHSYLAQGFLDTKTPQGNDTNGGELQDKLSLTKQSNHQMAVKILDLNMEISLLKSTMTSKEAEFENEKELMQRTITQLRFERLSNKLLWKTSSMS